MSRSYKQPYTKSKRFDATCRCHGSCSYCYDNRMHKNDKHPDLKEELKIGDYNMITPESPLPWKLVVSDTNDFNIIDAEYGWVDHKYPDETTCLSEENARYMVISANQYPVLLEALERIESTTTDKDTAEKIRNILIEQGVWK